MVFDAFEDVSPNKFNDIFSVFKDASHLKKKIPKLIRWHQHRILIYQMVEMGKSQF